jgi:hypothetical protein
MASFEVTTEVYAFGLSIILPLSLQIGFNFSYNHADFKGRGRFYETGETNKS